MSEDISSHGGETVREDLFKKLPPEILADIFSYELLIPYKKILPEQREVTYSQGITIIDGKAEYPFPTALFKVDRRTSWIARVCTWSINRLILGGKPDLTLQWLSTQPVALTRLVRRLDLLILPYQFFENNALDHFDCLLVSLGGYFELSTLHLSIDGSRLGYELDEDTPNHDWLKNIYQKLTPMFGVDGLAKVQDFFVYYPQWNSEEFKLERIVKGESYDSIARGKEEFSLRDHRLIHGWEYGLRDGTINGNMNSVEWNSDYEDYRGGDGLLSDSYDETVLLIERDAVARERESEREAEVTNDV